MKGLRQSNKGFTLVELVVVMTLVSVLAAVTTMSLIKWQRYSKYQTQQENAEILYMAARNKIAQLRADNALTEFIDRYYPENNLKNHIYKNNSDKSKVIYYAYCWDTDYASYKNNMDFSSGANKSGKAFIFELVDEYIRDAKILKNHICIMFNKNGDIYAIYISDSCKLGKDSKLIADSIKPEKLYDNCVGAYLSEQASK